MSHEKSLKGLGKFTLQKKKIQGAIWEHDN